MSTLRERPRAAIAVGTALLVVVVVALLVGSALGGGNDAPASPGPDANAVRAQLQAVRGQLHGQAGELAAAKAATNEWRAKARKAEQQLADEAVKHHHQDEKGDREHRSAAQDGAEASAHQGHAAIATGPTMKAAAPTSPGSSRTTAVVMAFPSHPARDRRGWPARRISQTVGPCRGDRRRRLPGPPVYPGRC